MEIISERKNLLLSAILVLIFAIGTASCTTTDNLVGGTAVGAALGAGIGALVGEPGIGAAIGAGAGALGGLAKDSMEKESQRREDQSQTNARMRQLEIDAEIDRQVADLQRRGYSADKYTYRATTTVGGRIVVDAIPRSSAPQVEIIR